MATAKKAAAATKAAAKPAAAEPTKSIDPGPLVDELGAIEKELAPLAGKIRRAELLRQTIRGLTPDAQNEVAGARFIALLGPRANKTTVDYYAVAKKIGLDRYAQFATASLETLAKHVNPGILAPHLKSESTGTRSLAVIEKGGNA